METRRRETRHREDMWVRERERERERNSRYDTWWCAAMSLYTPDLCLILMSATSVSHACQLAVPETHVG